MPRLSILHTLRETLNLFWREWRFFGTIVIGPVLIITGTSLIVRLTMQTAAGTALGILTIVVLMFSWVRLAVCCHRFVLLGEQPRSFIQGSRWQMRDTWFALYAIGIYLFAWVFMFLAVLGASALSPFLALLPNWLLIPLSALGVIAMWLFFAYLMGRLSLILPATAVDRRPAKDWMDWAWSQSEGNEWPLMFLLGVNPTVGGLLLDPITQTMIQYGNQHSALLASLIYGLALGLYFIATIFQVAVLSLSLKQIAAGKPEDNSQSSTAPDLNLQMESPA